MKAIQKSLITVSQRYGTPSFLFDANVIKEKYTHIRGGLIGSCDIFYSMKANPSLAICEYLRMLGSNCEVSSVNELLTALKAGFLPEHIIFVGPGKKYNEIEYAVQCQIKSIICESIDEVFCINELAKKYKLITSVMIRINPDFSIANAPIKMSGVATQFGIEVKQLVNAYDKIRQCEFISLDGIQIYNASRVLDIYALQKNILQILNLAKSLSEHLRIEWKTIDVGGGLGVPYFQNEAEINADLLIKNINVLFKNYNQRYPNTKFILELGRYLVAEAGYLIATVQSVKDSHDKHYIIVDAGMHCHMAVTGLGSFVHRNFPAHLISMQSKNNHESQEKKQYQVVGPLCTPGDVLLRDVEFSCVTVGDLMIISNTGAYGTSASPGRFLSHGSPSEILYYHNQLQLIRRRESIADLWSTQSSLNLT